MQGMPVEGFRNHVAIDGSLLGVSGRWMESVWSVVRLDPDEEMEQMHGCTLDAELDIQGSINRAELIASLVPSE